MHLRNSPKNSMESSANIRIIGLRGNFNKRLCYRNQFLAPCLFNATLPDWKKRRKPMKGRELSNRPLTESDLNQLLDTTFLKSVQHFSQTDSTNEQAIKMLSKQGMPETPCLVYAESQTAGRGRGSNYWWSRAGSLTFSVIISAEEFSLTPEKLIKLPLLTGLAVLRAGQAMMRDLPDCNNDFSLKWPNDVFLSARKVAGILIEVPSVKPASATDASAHQAVIGVGFNINNSFVDAPEDIRTKGISLFDYADSTFDRVEILNAFLDHLETLIRSLSKGLPILDDWSKHCLLSGKRVTLLVGDNEIAGDCLGLATNGALILQTNHGTQQFLGGVVKSWK